MCHLLRAVCWAANNVALALHDRPSISTCHAVPSPAVQVDAALKTAGTVSEVLEASFPVLKPETLDSPPRPLGKLPQRLQHFAVELPRTPEPQEQQQPEQQQPPGQQPEPEAAVAAA